MLYHISASWNRKGKLVKTFRACSRFCDLAETFSSSSSAGDEILAAGEQASVTTYNGKPGETLDSLWYQRFSVKVAKLTSLRHYRPHQPQLDFIACEYTIKWWSGKDLLPEEWGWKESIGTDTTNLLPALSDLLRIIHCNCQTQCGNPARRMDWAVQLYAACNCKGSACLNSISNEDEESEDSDIDELWILWCSCSWLIQSGVLYRCSGL